LLSFAEVRPLKILLDISIIGIGVIHPHMRGGGFRVDERLIAELAASGECELAFCANHSSVFHRGAEEYLLNRPALSKSALLGSPHSGTRSLRRMLAAAYRQARVVFPLGPLPGALRSGGHLLDRGVHRPVTDMPGGADIFHSTHFPLPPLGRGASPHRFLTIYDLRTQRFPTLYDARSRSVADAILKSVGRGDSVITTSQSSRDELLGTGRLQPDQVFVVPLAADPERFKPCSDPEALRDVRSRYGIGEGPYILAVSSIDIRKNMHLAIRAFTRLVREQPVGELQLVIAGASGSGTAEMAHALKDTREVRGRIVETGFVRDDDLAALYTGAVAFLYPSLYEGFGLPPLEAMQCGTPVITSNGSSLQEVVGDAGVMVDAEDVDALSAAMLDLLASPDLRARLSQRSLARATLFSWKRTGTAVLAAYRAALNAR
jgi:glycosyltransferase involved in cell wall biosynthesis